MSVRSSKKVPANVCVRRCVCGCSVCMRASYSLLSKSLWLKDLRLNLPSFTLTEARNFLPVSFQHHLSTLVSSTCLNSPPRHSKIRLAKICKPDPDMIKICCLVGSCDGMRSLPMPPVYSPSSFACLFGATTAKKSATPLLRYKTEAKTNIFSSLFLFFSAFFLGFAASCHQLTAIPFLSPPLSRTNKQCSKAETWRVALGPACPACLHLPAGWERWQGEVLE